MNWRKSSKSGPVGNCYELARPDAATFVLRDSKQQGTGPEFSFSFDGWAEIVASLIQGDMGLGIFSTPVGRKAVWAEAECIRRSTDEFVWTSVTQPELGELVFTMAEHDAFLYAVFADEMTAAENGGDMYPEGNEDDLPSHRVVNPAEHIAPEFLPF